MANRVLVICVCICIVGSSAAPASWLPCCCKAKQKAEHDGCSRSVCGLGAASPHTAECGDLVAPCCPVEDAHAPAGSLAPSCSSCRRLEQMRLVAAAGGAGGSDSVQPKLSFNSQPVQCDEKFLSLYHARASARSIPPLILKVNLEICSFLC